jgi:hypothetical protein
VRESGAAGGGAATEVVDSIEGHTLVDVSDRRLGRVVFDLENVGEG